MKKQSLLPIKWLCLSQLVLAGFAWEPCLAAESLVLASVRRIDPRTGELVSIEHEQIKPGKLYNHFSSRHGRYVWAFAKAGGGFSYALGAGSTELPGNFDLPTSPRETKELIAEASGLWFKRSRSEGSKVFVRLGTDEKWQVLRGRSIRSHFDIDNRLRWEWHGQRRVAIRHTNGYLWRYDGSWYVPANSYLSSAIHVSSLCCSSDCERIAAP